MAEYNNGMYFQEGLIISESDMIEGGQFLDTLEIHIEDNSKDSKNNP